ncbi:uncharacterized protein LOC128954184 [Oppia nitens]|uniref:uncharacterized protein LOC128954184 n=1 Tax=Oppia nitens TaxID=1686743 RepID=UPI0023DA42C8|nr:uncharacterized protein LOC128954184 [Oppia nitens]
MSSRGNDGDDGDHKRSPPPPSATGDGWLPKEDPDFFDDLEPDYRQPVDPPKVKIHSPFLSPDDPYRVRHKPSATAAAAAAAAAATAGRQRRHIFGTNPTPVQQLLGPPVPPLPLPPNSYHQKPKYWQTRGTGHMQQTNRIILGFMVAVGLVSYALDRWSGIPERFNWGRRDTRADVIERREDLQLLADLMRKGVSPDDMEVAPDRRHYRNPRRQEDRLRWDFREIDKRMAGLKHMQNPVSLDPK